MTQTMDKGFPQRVVKHFPGISIRVDAAFQYKGKQGCLTYWDTCETVLTVKKDSTKT